MKVIVKRTVRLIEPIDDRRFGNKALTLRDFETDHAYILLGEPGMGKSTEFKEEAKRIGVLSPTPVRRFISLKPENHPEWQMNSLFLDGLDEVRIGEGDPRGALDRVIAHLEELGSPKFRLSCRSLSWLGTGDREHLKSISSPGEIPVLQLNPLNYDNIREIVLQLGGDATSFIQQAREHDMDAFLRNPQLLSVLFKSVANGGWPNSPRETFEKACQQLITERNQEHFDARSSEPLPHTKAVLNAAGQLSVLMLIANKSGWSVDDTEDCEVLSLRGVEIQDRSALRAAFDSGIFEGSRTCRTPIHRLLAEFLGALYLHEKIEDGLNAQRALALLMGHDGIPFPDLRGLAAWLAAFNSQARKTLIIADPVAVAFNGDTTGFSLEERRILLKNLEHEIDLPYTWPSVVSLVALVSNQGMSLFQELIDSSTRSRRRRMIVYVLLNGFSRTHTCRGEDRKHFCKSRSEIDQHNLLKIVRDSSWQEEVRCEALRALNRLLIDSSVRGTVLREILEDIEEERLPDKGGHLLGTLLDLLYPEELRPAEIWNHIGSESVADSSNAHWKFYSALVDRSTGEQVKELLDSLCDQASEVIPKLKNRYLAYTVPKLLSMGIESYGDEMDIPNLYRWFKLVGPSDYSPYLIPLRSSTGVSSEVNRICSWLRERKYVQYELIQHGLREKEHKIGTERLIETVGIKFLGRAIPKGFRLWCLMRAGELWAAHPKMAEELACWSICPIASWDPPLSDDAVNLVVSGNIGLLEWNTKRLKAKTRTKRREANEKRRQAMALVSSRKEKQKELESLRQHKAELAQGSFPPWWLHDLAEIYWSGPMLESGYPQSRLRSYMDGDESLLRATLSGFRSLLNRDDLPDLYEIANSHENRRLSCLALPFLAGMEEQERETGDSLSRLCEKGRRRALGFYLVTNVYHQGNIPIANTNLSLWYRQAMTRYPDAVADSIVAIHNACIRSKADLLEYLLELAFDHASDHVAQLTIGRMFTVFPTRCGRLQLKSLRAALWKILTLGIYVGELQKIILKRLNRKSMDVGQKAQWLCAGLCIDGNYFLPMLLQFLSTGNKSRVRHVTRFLTPEGRKPLLENYDSWTSEEISLLVQALGRQTQVPKICGHQGSNYARDSEIITVQSFLTSCIRELSERTDDDAAEALFFLAADPDLAAQNREIIRARKNQAINCRAAKRHDLNLEQIQKTLQGGPPANAGDLVTLTIDVLDQLSDRIRDGQTNDWRQYWHCDQKTSRPIKPHCENYCRDLLLSDLKMMLIKYQIDAQPEGRYADHNRADIRVSYGSDFAVPIEIKKNEHRDIWGGISNQLVPKYTRDPEADGYGIYLVLWFGTSYMRGNIPNDPQELRNRLKERLDPALRKKIHIVVIDLSPSGRYTEKAE